MMKQPVLHFYLLIITIIAFLGVSCETSTPVEIIRKSDEPIIASILTPTSDPTSLPKQSTSTPVANSTAMLLLTATSNSPSMTTPRSSLTNDLTSLPNESASTPIPNPTNTLTSTVVSGSSSTEEWLTYSSTFYNYEISYPQDAKLRRYGVSGFPTEEQPENMTSEQYLTQLRQTYPEDICITISYKSGVVSIMAPPENGGKYGDCAGFGIGAYDLIEHTENIIVDGVTYSAEGFEIREQNEAATWRGEFLEFRLSDDTLITLSGEPDNLNSYDEYMNTREILLQIIMSYHKN